MYLLALRVQSEFLVVKLNKNVNIGGRYRDNDIGVSVMRKKIVCQLSIFGIANKLGSKLERIDNLIFRFPVYARLWL